MNYLYKRPKGFTTSLREIKKLLMASTDTVLVVNRYDMTIVAIVKDVSKLPALQKAYGSDYTYYYHLKEER